MASASVGRISRSRKRLVVSVGTVLNALSIVISSSLLFRLRAKSGTAMQPRPIAGKSGAFRAQSAMNFSRSSLSGAIEYTFAQGFQSGLSSIWKVSVSGAILRSLPLVVEQAEVVLVSEAAAKSVALAQVALILKPKLEQHIIGALVGDVDDRLDAMQLHLGESISQDGGERLGHDALAPAGAIEDIACLSMVVSLVEVMETAGADDTVVFLSRDTP